MPLDAPARFSALAVANFFVGRALDESERYLTNMALQKVLYFADGEYIAKERRRLFDDRIEAWQYGPVVPAVYHEFKRFGKQPIMEKATALEIKDNATMRLWTPEIPASEDSDADRAFLGEIWDRYGKRPAIDLMKESHRDDGPWAQVRSKAGGEITPALMFNFFSKQQH
jgi:uncharacterized phage-associated protein